MNDKNKKNEKTLGEKIPRIGPWGNLFAGAFSSGEIYDTFESMTKKGINLDPEDEKRTIDKAKQIHPNYNEYKKWEEQDKKEQKKKDAEMWNKWWSDPNRQGTQPPSGSDKGYQKYNQIFKEKNNPVYDLLLKQNRDISEDEIKMANRAAWYDIKDKDMQNKMSNKISAWHDEAYGTQSSKDATGKTIMPKIKTPFVNNSKPLKTKEGLSIDDGFKKIASTLSELDKNSEKPNTTESLQKTLNAYDFEPKLKEDNDLGPKTTYRLKETMVNHGVNDLQSQLLGFHRKPQLG